MDNMDLVVFTDLDGCLLDHDTYFYKAAMPALAQISERRIPLIFATSKTRPEVEQWQRKIGISEPFIIENGAAIFFPEGYKKFHIDRGSLKSSYTVIQLGVRYEEIRKFMESVKDRFKIRGFGDMPPEEISALSGLTIEESILAKNREFTEPFVMEDISKLPEMKQMAKAQGFKLTRGGLFFHLIGEAQDKGKAVRIASGIFSRNGGSPIKSIGIGDSVNDVSMLQAVDIPVLIPHPDCTFEEINIPHLRRASMPGSMGWNQIMLDLLNQIP